MRLIFPMIGLFYLSISLGHGQSMDRMAIGSAGDCQTIGGQVYTVFVGEPVSGTDLSTIPYLTLGILQPETPSLLAVHFEAFHGNWQGEFPELSWEILQHPNAVGFLVKRSQDGISFTSIARVQELQIGSSYFFRDNTLAQGKLEKLFYQIVWQGKDGSEVSSEIIQLSKRKGILGLEIYPNPVKNQLMVQSPEELGEVELLLVDARGRTCWQGKMEQSLEIPMGQFPAGLYHLKARSAFLTEVRKIWKD